MSLSLNVSLVSDEVSAKSIEEMGDHVHNENHRTFPDMLEETRDILKDFYRPYNLRLAELLQNDAYKWE